LWPFRNKSKHFEFDPKSLRAEIASTKKDRIELGVEPDSKNWECLLDLAKYFNMVIVVSTQHATPAQKLVVAAIQKLVVDGEAEMDFDTTTVATGMLASIAFPVIPGEDMETYNHRVISAYAVYKTQLKAY
jgi:hypothetical protein